MWDADYCIAYDTYFLPWREPESGDRKQRTVHFAEKCFFMTICMEKSVIPILFLDA